MDSYFMGSRKLRKHVSMFHGLHVSMFYGFSFYLLVCIYDVVCRLDGVSEDIIIFHFIVFGYRFIL